MSMLRTIISCVACLGLVGARECPAPHKHHVGHPVFTTKAAGELITVRNGHFAELECCMHGYDEIIWSKLNMEKRAWEVFNISESDSDRLEFINNGQTLVFKETELVDDGTYMCHPTQNETIYKDISRKYAIEVIACDPLARGPYAIAPLPCENTNCNVGQDVTLPCNAYFGCNEGDDLRLVEWLVSRDDSKEHHWIPATEFNSRYKVKTVSSGNGTEIQTNLTIQDVREADLRLKFRCMLVSAQIIHGNTDIYVKLVKFKSDDELVKEKETASFTIVAILAAVAFTIVMLIIFVAITVEQGRKTRKHLTKDMERKISGEVRLLNMSDV